MHHRQHNKFDHDLHARSKEENDFWGQIRRTVNGQPVDEEQIAMIVDRIQAKLAIQEGDILLDLACGNGALSSRLFPALAGYQGVDFSARLVEIASKHFVTAPKVSFSHSGASEYIDSESHPERFTKMLCYGSFSYFRQEDAANVLGQLNNRFKNVSKAFIGNLPDKNLVEKFYGANRPGLSELLDNESPIGIWRSPDEFITLANAYGWNAEVSVMPEKYYAAHYRYDILLTR